MRKLRKAAVVAAALCSVGFLGAGSAYADGHGGGGHGGGGQGGKLDISQSTQCRSHDLNVNVLGEVGLINGLLGNGLNGEGDAGAQATSMGSKMGCDNKALSK